MTLRPIARVVALAAILLALLAAPARADDLAVARAVIGKQIELIRKGDVAALRACFTPRLRHRITEDRIKAAQKDAANYTVGNLVASAAVEKGVLKIKMKNGRPLTRLVKPDAEWLTDLLWFP